MDLLSSYTYQGFTAKDIRPIILSFIILGSEVREYTMSSHGDIKSLILIKII